MLKNEIKSLLEEAIKVLGIEAPVITVDYPTDASHGDYTTNIAMVAAKKLGKNPRELASDLQEKLKSSELFEKVEVAGPGFINFWVKDEVILKKMNQQGDVKQIGKGKKVVVEYSSPNIAKPFTIGHLRSTLIGDAIANILEAVGYEVYRDNHVGDWGTQFGKQIYAIKEWGNEEEIENSDRPVKLLVDLYVKFHQEAEKNPEIEEKARVWFKKLEDGDPEARELWKKCIEWSWKEFDAIYQELDVPSGGNKQFENQGRGYGESFFEDKMASIIKELEEKNLLKVGKEGAKIVEFPEESNLPPLMILKKDGATLYATRDLATDKFRLAHYGKDILIVNEVGAEQSLYFRQLYKLEEMLGWYKVEQRVHVKHGLYRFKEGKMSTRKGNVVWLEDVLEEATKRAFSLAKEGFEFEGSEVLTVSGKHSRAARHIKGFAGSINVQRVVGIGSLKWNDLKRSPEQDISFDWDEILNMQGNAGPYMQYAYVRTKSIVDKAKESGVIAFSFPQVTKKLAKEERALLSLLGRFHEILEDSAGKYSPNLLCLYLFEIAQTFNLFYQKHQILKAEEADKTFRLALTQTTGEILKQGLYILGIAAPNQM
jgi:arginyl-tRNA synthetase